MRLWAVIRIMTGALSVFKGGFSIAEPSHYLPNVYATRMGYDIIRYFKHFYENYNFNIPNLDFLSPEDTFNYIVSCYDSNEGGFKGYSNSDELVPDSYLNHFFQYAA